MNVSGISWYGSKRVWQTFLCLLVLCLTCFAQAAESRVVFQSTDTPPFFSSSLPDDGIAGAILHLISERAGVEYAIQYLPVKRFRGSEAAFIVGDPELLNTSKRIAVFPIAVFSTALFYYKPRHGGKEFSRIDSLSGYTLGVLRGTVEDKGYLARKGIKVHESDSIESLLRMLKRGRVDFCILVHGAGMRAIKRLYPQEQAQFARQVIAGAERPIAIMIDMGVPEGARIAGRYASVLRETLDGEEYRNILRTCWDSAEVPDGIMPKLKSFVEFYAPTWEN